MVEPNAFEVGADLAVTPGSVILRTPVFELIQYRPATASVRQIPVLIVPPTINKFYIMDLAPGRSLAEYLVASGLQVFMISWRNPDARHAAWDFNTYGRAILEGHRVMPMDDAAKLEADIRALPGIVGTGLFLGVADVVLVGDQHNHFRLLEERHRKVK